MALRINTNIASLNAHKQLIKTDNMLSSSLEKLSSGLRINKAADDASGMAIADSLRSQALGLGQAIRNGNDGISIVQTADAALEESINIINVIKQKSIQAAQDGQTTESRKAIQADISKLREELDTIAKTTAFNNQKLLSGNFTDKKFQIGAYAGETVGISIQSTEAQKIGHITTAELSFTKIGIAELEIYSNLLDETFSLASQELAYDNDAEHGIGEVADAINRLSDSLGISATAVVEVSTDGSINAGTTDSTFAINGITIGALDVKENDQDGALVSSINNKTSEHGVTASVDANGVLKLTSTDNRAIQVTVSDGTADVLGVTSMQTLGVVEVRQEGTSQITITDANASEGIAVSSERGYISISGAAATTKSSTVTSGTKFVATTLGSGTVIQGTFTYSGTGMASTLGDSVLTAGSTVTTETQIESGTVLGGDFKISGMAATAGDETSYIKAGSTIAAESRIGSGSIFKGDVSAYLSGGGIYVSGTGDNTYTRLSGDATTVEVKAGTDLVLTEDAWLSGAVTRLCGDSVLVAGSYLDSTFDVKEDVVLTADMTLTAGSTLSGNVILNSGSYLVNREISGYGTVTGNMTLAANTLLGDETLIYDGSSLGGDVNLNERMTVGADTDLSVAAGSVLHSGSTIAAGTLLRDDIVGNGGQTFTAGTTLTLDVKMCGDVTTTKDMIIESGSILWEGSTLATNDDASATTTTSNVGEATAYRLSDVNVTSQEGAQIGIAVADAALKSLDKVRSDLGSVQNQLTSTIANISTTRVNVSAAESTIRDVDFAEESATFTKMQILTQAGTFAMAQANASSQQVLSLLQ